MAKNKLKPEQSEQIVDLASQGTPAGEISKQINIPLPRVSGVISNAVREGRLAPSSEGTRRPARAPSGPPLFPSKVPQSEASMNPSLVPTPMFASLPPADEGWRPVVGAADGFTHPTQQIEYRLERIEPRGEFQGVLEVTQSQPEEDDIGKRFGSGTYRLYRREGTKLPTFKDIIISLQ